MDIVRKAITRNEISRRSIICRAIFRKAISSKGLVVALSAALLGGMTTAVQAAAGDAELAAAKAPHFPGVALVDAKTAQRPSPAIAPAIGELTASDRAYVVPPAKDAPALRRAADSLSFIVPEEGRIDAVLAMFDAVQQVRAQAVSGDLRIAARVAGVPALLLNEQEAQLLLTQKMILAPLRAPLAVLPHGVRRDGRWTAVSRYYQLEDSRQVVVIERDLAATGQLAQLDASRVNWDFSGSPGVATVSTDGKGRILQRAFWVRGPKSYEVIVVDARPESAAVISAESTEADAGSTDNAPVGHSIIVLARSFKQF